MLVFDDVLPRDISRKLRATASFLGCSGQKELCALFRQVNPATEFGLDRSYKWMQGRTLPRSPRVYEDWSAVLGLDRPGSWVASTSFAEFVEVVAARHGADRAASLRGADGEGAPSPTRRGPAAPAVAREESYLCGVYACYSHAQSPYYRGRIIRGALRIEAAARRAEGLVARYSQALPNGLGVVEGPVLQGLGRAVTLSFTAGSAGATPVVCQVLLPAPPGTLLAGVLSSFVMVDPSGQPPYATRIAMIRVPADLAMVEGTNRYMAPDPAGFGRDLASLALSVAATPELAALLARFLSVPDERRLGTDRIAMDDYTALAAVCDRAWLDTLERRDDSWPATAGDRAAPTA